MLFSETESSRKNFVREPTGRARARWRAGPPLGGPPDRVHNGKAATTARKKEESSMGVLSERDRTEIRKRLGELAEPVRLVYFTQELECATCREGHRLLEELASLSDKLSLEVHNFLLDRDQVAAYGVDKVPATVLVGDRDRGIRYYGVPSGYEFAALLDDIQMVSRRDSGLSDSSREKLRALSAPLHVQVFVTPT